MFVRLLAVDPSLTCSGWALFEAQSGSLLGVGKIKSLPASHSLALRFEDLQTKITKCLGDLKLGQTDLLVCESQTTMRDPRAAFKVEQVRGMFETLARGRGLNVPGRVNPRTVHRELMGLKGKQLPRAQVKETAIFTVQALYQAELLSLGFPTSMQDLRRHQDVIDAILIGRLAVTRIQSATRTGIAPHEVFEAAVRQPFTMKVRAR